MADLVRIGSGALSAAINPFGAELTHLTDAAGRELMTDADPAFWKGHAPLLFPIVGRLNGDEYRLDGQSYAMPKHGLARRLPFEVVEAAADRATFRLTDSASTRAAYPFAFALEMAFAVEDVTLTMTASVTNADTRDMPASFGFHPAFAWPLPYNAARADHRIDFAQDEPGTLRAITPDGLIGPDEKPSPVEARMLHLRDSLFEHDALVWAPVESRALRYGAGERFPSLDIAYDAGMLGVWTKPGAAYVCIEPWHGFADPEGFAGEIWDKPGIERLAPGERRDYMMRVTLVP